jgi:predicted Co/Zn/Cd cation transporter (cation efflux family)
LLAVAVTYVAATAFYTQQVIAKQAAIGAIYSTSQQIDTFTQNFTGLWIFGAMIAIALLVGFIVAYFVKRLVKPLAPVAYPAAGAAAMLVMLTLIEQQLGGGAGVIGGARDAIGLALQALAGFIGGAVFSFKRPR